MLLIIRFTTLKVITHKYWMENVTSKLILVSNKIRIQLRNYCGQRGASTRPDQIETTQTISIKCSPEQDAYRVV